MGRRKTTGERGMERQLNKTLAAHKENDPISTKPILLLLAAVVVGYGLYRLFKHHLPGEHRLRALAGLPDEIDTKVSER